MVPLLLIPKEDQAGRILGNTGIHPCPLLQLPAVPCPASFSLQALHSKAKHWLTFLLGLGLRGRRVLLALRTNSHR